MSYLYSRLQSDAHRDIAHWRGARKGMRVLSLPDCSGWLQRQANDAFYDFWPDLVIGSALDSDASRLQEAAPVITYVMQKDQAGAWFIDAWHEDDAALPRQVAANSALRRTRAVSRGAYTKAGFQSPDGSRGSAVVASNHLPIQDARCSDDSASFIIEIGTQRI